jgi:LysM repeat protein
MTEDSMLHPGNEVIVRLAEGQSPPPTPTPRSTHIIKAGHSLWLIAALYDLTLEQLLELNGLTTDSVIRPGEELIIRLPTPTPPPTETPMPSPTSTADLSLASNLSPSPTSGSENARVSLPATPVVDTSLEDNADTDLMTALAAITGLGILAGAIVVIFRRQQN